MFCWLIRVTVVLWLWHFGCLCQLIVNELPRFLCETCSLCWAVECHNWWLLVLQLGNCPKAQNPVLVLQSKIHSCANIARKAKTVGFPPTVLFWDYMHYKQIWYLIWQVYLSGTAVGQRITGLGFFVSLIAGWEKCAAETYLETADII